MKNIKGQVLKFMANNKDWDLKDREGNWTSTTTRTAKALGYYTEEVKKAMEILVADGLANKRQGNKYCREHTRYWLTEKGLEVAKL